jgi:hypothetical protein
MLVGITRSFSNQRASTVAVAWKRTNRKQLATQEWEWKRIHKQIVGVRSEVERGISCDLAPAQSK